MRATSFGIGCSACGAHKTIGLLSVVPDACDAVRLGWRAAAYLPGGYYCPQHSVPASKLMLSEQDTRHSIFERACELYEAVRRHEERNDDNA